MKKGMVMKRVKLHSIALSIEPALFRILYHRAILLYSSIAVKSVKYAPTNTVYKYIKYIRIVNNTLKGQSNEIFDLQFVS